MLGHWARKSQEQLRLEAGASAGIKGLVALTAVGVVDLVVGKAVVVFRMGSISRECKDLAGDFVMEATRATEAIGLFRVAALTAVTGVVFLGVSMAILARLLVGPSACLADLVLDPVNMGSLTAIRVVRLFAVAPIGTACWLVVPAAHAAKAGAGHQGVAGSTTFRVGYLPGNEIRRAGRLAIKAACHTDARLGRRSLAFLATAVGRGRYVVEAAHARATSGARVVLEAPVVMVIGTDVVCDDEDALRIGSDKAAMNGARGLCGSDSSEGHAGNEVKGGGHAFRCVICRSSGRTSRLFRLVSRFPLCTD
jgi:hypothetical protein